MNNLAQEKVLDILWDKISQAIEKKIELNENFIFNGITYKIIIYKVNKIFYSIFYVHNYKGPLMYHCRNFYELKIWIDENWDKYNLGGKNE